MFLIISHQIFTINFFRKFSSPASSRPNSTKTFVCLTNNSRNSFCRMCGRSALCCEHRTGPSTSPLSLTSMYICIYCTFKWLNSCQNLTRAGVTSPPWRPLLTKRRNSKPTLSKFRSSKHSFYAEKVRNNSYLSFHFEKSVDNRYLLLFSVILNTQNTLWVQSTRSISSTWQMAHWLPSDIIRCNECNGPDSENYYSLSDVFRCEISTPHSSNCSKI